MTCLNICLQEILEIEQIMDEQMGLELNEANLDSVLDEIRPYLVGALHEQQVYVVITKTGPSKIALLSPRCCRMLRCKVVTVLLAQTHT